jgi:hypothetical protein
LVVAFQVAAESAQMQPALSAVAVELDAHSVHAPAPELKARDEQLMATSLVAEQAVTLYAGSVRDGELQGVHAAPRLVVAFDQLPGGHASQDASAVELHGDVKVPAAQVGVEQIEQVVVMLKTELDQVPGAHDWHDASLVELHGSMYDPAAQTGVEQEAHDDDRLMVASDQNPGAQRGHDASLVVLQGNEKVPAPQVCGVHALQADVWLIVASDQKPAAHAAQVASAVAVQAVVDVPAKHTEQATQLTPPFVLYVPAAHCAADGGGLESRSRSRSRRAEGEGEAEGE